MLVSENANLFENNRALIEVVAKFQYKMREINLLYQEAFGFRAKCEALSIQLEDWERR
jgi:hypothetical protein